MKPRAYWFVQFYIPLLVTVGVWKALVEWMKATLSCRWAELCYKGSSLELCIEYVGGNPSIFGSLPQLYHAQMELTSLVRRPVPQLRCWTKTALDHLGINPLAQTESLEAGTVEWKELWAGNSWPGVLYLVSSPLWALLSLALKGKSG